MNKNRLTLIAAVFVVASIFLLFQVVNMAKMERLSSKSNAELIEILSDPDDPDNLFVEVTDELGKRGASAAEAAPSLAYALIYPRRDSYRAAYALIKIGPSAESAIPILFSELKNPREDVQRYAALSLGAIGQPAECAMPSLAKLLWHKSSWVRSASAIAMDAITGENLVDKEDKLDPQSLGSIRLDEPEGNFVSGARDWWFTIGQNKIWPTQKCELLE